MLQIELIAPLQKIKWPKQLGMGILIQSNLL